MSFLLHHPPALKTLPKCMRISVNFIPYEIELEKNGNVMQKKWFTRRSRGRLFPAFWRQNVSRLKPQKVNFSSKLWASRVRLFLHSSRRLHRNWKLNIKACTFGNVFHWIIHSCSCENSSGEGKARQLWINSNDKFGLRTPQGQDDRRPTLV